MLNSTLWKDVTCGNHNLPHLCSVTGNKMDGEPISPIEQEFKIQPGCGLPSRETEYQYRMLSRLKSDCEYYLGNGNGYAGNLWAKEEREHLEYMKSLWNGFSEEEKPEWLTWEDIEAYERKMIK